MLDQKENLTSGKDWLAARARDMLRPAVGEEEFAVCINGEGGSDQAVGAMISIGAMDPCEEVC